MSEGRFSAESDERETGREGEEHPGSEVSQKLWTEGARHGGIGSGRIQRGSRVRQQGKLQGNWGQTSESRELMQLDGDQQ